MSEKLCSHREAYRVTTGGDETDETTIPICKVLFQAGSHLPHCKAPDIAGVDCPIPLVAKGTITIQEGSDWLDQIKGDKPVPKQERS